MSEKKQEGGGDVEPKISLKTVTLTPTRWIGKDFVFFAYCEFRKGKKLYEATQREDMSNAYGIQEKF